ncbi:hypothetical protein NP233_g9419 [Leucocoprinus birnbaumii]|uniref:Uncharacterized protein n=1 Tax=Leucocoprinus birnbaumii TaxID=56174 RepID=A0AAD5VL30_9AGAR|nr:hypothetical protein NP233_g9419 [Leucocoprinus birnbaumii]
MNIRVAKVLVSFHKLRTSRVYKPVTYKLAREPSNAFLGIDVVAASFRLSLRIIKVGFKDLCCRGEELLDEDDNEGSEPRAREVKSNKKEDDQGQLVTPLRLQRNRHLRSLKRRRLEHQKEQRPSSSAYRPFTSLPIQLTFYSRSANRAKRVFEKKAKAAAVKASHKATTA